MQFLSRMWQHKMTYHKYLTGPIQTDDDGNSTTYTRMIVGKIIKVRIAYGTSGPETKLKILTEEREEVVALYEFNENTIQYPRLKWTPDRAGVIPLQHEPIMDHLFSVGHLKIEVRDADPNARIEQIMIIYQD